MEVVLGLLGWRIGIALLLGLTWTQPGWARSLRVLETSPTAETVVDGRNAQYSVHFDGLVDHRGSRLWIGQDGKLVETVPVSVDAAPEVLFGSAPLLSEGRYELHWLARSAPDGEVTEGAIGFTVRR